MSETRHEEELLGAYLDGELDGASRERVASHLERCAACRDELEKLRDLHSQLQESSVPDPGAAYWASFSARVDQRITATLPAAATRAQPSWWRRSVAWLRPVGGSGWTRLAGAAAVVLLAVFVGVRTFIPETRVPTPMQRGAPRSLGSRSGPDARSSQIGAPVDVSEIQDEVALQSPKERVKSEERAGIGLAPTPSAAPGEPMPSAVPERNRSQAGPEPEEAVAEVRVEKDGSGLVNMGSATPALRPVAEARDVGRLELEVRHPPQEVEERTLQFVGAALGSDVATARSMGEELQRLAPNDSAMVRSVAAWLQSSSRSVSEPKARTLMAAPQAQGLLALDALVWPHRADPAWHGVLQEVAQRLVAGAPSSTALRSRAVVYAEWLAVEAKDPADRSRWGAVLEALQR